MSVAFELEQRLLRVLEQYPSVAVALSGGVDSSVVAAAAVRVLGDRAVAVTADSASMPRSELLTAQDLARLIGIRHHIVRTDEFANPNYLKNSGDRCYHCKSELYGQIEQLLPELGVKVICSGANLDDLGDYRPGLTAAAEHQVRHPLQDAGFHKAEVRALARHWQLPVAEKPASPCLSSRIVPGLEVTHERTLRIERAEAFLKSLELSDCRVRYHHHDLARIEVLPDQLPIILSVRDDVIRELLQLGFRYVTIDLAGLRSGSMNDLVPLTVRQRFATPMTTTVTDS